MANHLAGESSWQDLVEDGCEGTSPVDASPQLQQQRSFLFRFGVLIPHRCHRERSLSKILHAHPLVGRVSVLTGQAKPNQYHRRAQYPLEISDDGDRSPFAGYHWLLTECRAQRCLRGVEDRTIELSSPRTAAV